MDTNINANMEVPQTVVQMKPKRPTVVTVAAILLIVLTVFVAGLGAATQLGLIRGGFGGRQFTPRQFRSGNFTPPSGFIGNGAGANGFPSTGGGTNGLPGAGTGGTGTRTFNPNRTGAASLFRTLRTLQPIILGLEIILLVGVIVAVIGLFMNKRWGAILAIVISALVILLTIPSMIRIFSSITLVENLVRIGLAIAVIVLLLLPSARKPYTVAAAAGDDEEVERVVR